MARATRVALDLALVSLKKTKPVVSNVWGRLKKAVSSSKIEVIVHNPVVRTIESGLVNFTDFMETKMESLRDQQIPKEIKYLERELEAARKRQSGKGKTTTSKLKPALGSIWQYAKVELAPPLTQNFFQGAAVKKFEKSVSASADGIIASLRESIKQIDIEAVREIQEKEAAIKAELERKKAEAKKKEAEMKLKAEAAKKEKAKEQQASAVKKAAATEVKEATPIKEKKKGVRNAKKKKRTTPKKKDVPKTQK